MSIIKIFTGPKCPSCLLLKEKLKNHPKKANIEWIDTSTPNGYAEATLFEIYMLPTAVLENDREITGVGPIIKAVDES
jgi:predicted thioredoxin/glutaredoxin